MSGQQTMASTTAREKAIRTLIRDVRIPKEIRTALADFQDIQTHAHSRAIHQVGDARSAGQRNCFSQGEPITIDGEVNACFYLNDSDDDWSVEINGHRQEHVTLEVAIALVECALVLVEISVARLLANRIQ